MKLKVDKTDDGFSFVIRKGKGIYKKPYTSGIGSKLFRYLLSVPKDGIQNIDLENKDYEVTFKEIKEK